MPDLAPDSVLIQALPAILGILGFRLFPFVGYVAITRRYPWFVRLGVVASYGAMCVLAVRTGKAPPGWLFLSYVYYSAAGWAAYELLPYVRSRMAWFGVATSLFWIVPVVLVRPPPMSFLMVGWDATLSGYSYGVDTRGKTERSLARFLFFLLVNPVLVHRNRGRPISTSRFTVAGLARFGWGVVVVLLAVAVLEPLHARAAAGYIAPARAAWTRLPCVGALRIAGEYAAQSGVASIQLGLMYQLGYKIPERYRYPLLARSPADFWRRWNTYVGDWARSYVYLPLVLALSRRSTGGDKLRSHATAIVVTFGVVGALHDAFVVAAEGRLSISGLEWFVVAGMVVVAWSAVARRLSTLSTSRHPGTLLPWVEHVAFLVAASYAAAELWW